ncbi:MAG: hypothetical protein GVY09_02530 [Gammaproteobacteria bacterium]|nr:hypothetical protein [Gammaproteobacteria bacterium]
MAEGPAAASARKSRRRGGGAWVLAAIGAVLAAGGWLWLSANFERQLREVSVGASPEARANPFLAAERFLVDSGIEARSTTAPELLRDPPPPADMLVVDGLPPLNAARRERLRDWLAAGGRMLVEAVHLDTGDAAPRPEHFLAGFGAQLRRDAQAGGDDEVLASVRLPDSPQPLTVGFAPEWYLADRLGAAAGEVSADGRPRLLEYRVGAGTLYVVSDTLWLGNARIGRHDHALLLALLAADRERVWLLHAVSVPSLAMLLWRAAPAAMVSALLLLMLLLWHLGRRLGPLLPAPDAARRDLLEHLQAAGDFVWRQGRGGLLVAQTRRRLERQWLRRHPALRGLDTTERARRIAAQTGLSPDEVQAALYGPVGDAAGLVRVTAVLQRLVQARAPDAGAGRGHQGRSVEADTDKKRAPDTAPEPQHQPIASRR